MTELSEEELGEIRERIENFRGGPETDDVAQKRFSMNNFFDYLLEKDFKLNDRELVGREERLEVLREFDGYMYKISQDFLLASSTMEKEKHLEKIVGHISKKLPEE